jgi:ATP-dependent DNA helicase DinG
VVVANHNLVLAALDMEAGSVLPDTAETFWIMDECHALHAKAIDRFSAKHTLKGAADWLKDLPGLHARVVHALRLPKTLIEAGDTSAIALRGYLTDLHQALTHTGAFEDRPHRRFKNGVLPAWVADLGRHIVVSAQTLQGVLADLREGLRQRSEKDARLAQKLLNEFGFYVGKVDAVVATWELLLQDDALTRSPTARWIEKYAGNASEDDFLICAAPLTATQALDRVLWRRASAVVLTSSTITACASFDLFLSQTGLLRYPEIRLLRLDSPFDYQHKARLVIPWMQSDPRDAAAHTREVTQLLPTLLSAEGSLVLFASAHAMRETFGGLAPDLRDLILMQGTLPKAQILERHRQAISQGKKSVIFGLSASFGEGVDLPGALCSCVVIAKIPFTVPNDPWSEAKAEWIERQGQSAFMEMIVPEAGVKLNQNSGRLLRTEEDWGVVYILDTRLARALGRHAAQRPAAVSAGDFWETANR